MDERYEKLIERANRAKTVATEIEQLEWYTEDNQSRHIEATSPMALVRKAGDKFPMIGEVLQLVELGRQAKLGKLRLELEELLGGVPSTVSLPDLPTTGWEVHPIVPLPDHWASGVMPQPITTGPKEVSRFSSSLPGCEDLKDDGSPCG